MSNPDDKMETAITDSGGGGVNSSPPIESGTGNGTGGCGGTFGSGSSDGGHSSQILSIMDALVGLGLEPTNPMYYILFNLTKQLGDMFVTQDTLLKGNRALLKADRKVTVDTAVSFQ